MRQPRYYWKQCYEMGDRVHWALCDTQTDADAPPHRVSCLEMILWDHHSQDLPNQLMPKLIVELLNAHYAKAHNDQAHPTAAKATVDGTENLAALDESDKVAILASKQNLDDLIWAMHRSLAQADWDKVRMKRMYELLAGMRQLSIEAFPPNVKISESTFAASDGWNDDAVERLLLCATDLKTHIMKQQACHSMLAYPDALLLDTQEAINDVKSLRHSNSVLIDGASKPT